MRHDDSDKRMKRCLASSGFGEAQGENAACSERGEKRPDLSGASAGRAGEGAEPLELSSKACGYMKCFHRPGYPFGSFLKVKHDTHRVMYSFPARYLPRGKTGPAHESLVRDRVFTRLYL